MLLRENDIDVLCVSETWLDSHLPDRFIYVEGYNVFRTDAGQGRGTCMFVKSNLSSTCIKFELLPCKDV